MATAFVPTLADVEGIEPGVLALDCFGRWSRVREVLYRGTDVAGRPFVGFATEFGPNSTVSGSYKVGELVRTVPLCSAHTSAELDVLERGVALVERTMSE